LKGIALSPSKSSTTAEKIERHVDFLERRNVERPLIGAIHGWENLSRYVEDTESFFPRGEVTVQDLSCDRFIRMYENWAESLDQGDDLFRTLEPLPFFPWSEAAVGCPVNYTGKNFWSSRKEDLSAPDQIHDFLEQMLPENVHLSESTDLKIPGTIATTPVENLPESSRQWLVKYEEMLSFLSGHFSEGCPIGQSILRGPLDMAAAVFGDENMIYLFYDQPALMQTFLSVAASVFLNFVYIQNVITPPFSNGSVIGSYYIWTHGSCLRYQEDAMALLSPDLYREFVFPLDCAIASTAETSLFHLHSSGLHLLDVLLESEGMDILQVSKDQGVDLEKILPALNRIQEAGKCLLVKGRLNSADVHTMKKNLDYRGLCIQAVVLDQKEADDFLAAF
jgi:hypothetical protein